MLRLYLEASGHSEVDGHRPEPVHGLVKHDVGMTDITEELSSEGEGFFSGEEQTRREDDYEAMMEALSMMDPLSNSNVESGRPSGSGGLLHGPGPSLAQLAGCSSSHEDGGVDGGQERASGSRAGKSLRWTATELMDALDVNHDGVLSREEALASVGALSGKQCEALLPAPAADAEAIGSKVFDVLDQDRSGDLSKQEIRRGLEALYNGASPPCTSDEGESMQAKQRRDLRTLPSAQCWFRPVGVGPSSVILDVAVGSGIEASAADFAEGPSGEAAACGSEAAGAAFDAPGVPDALRRRMAAAGFRGDFAGAAQREASPQNEHESPTSKRAWCRPVFKSGHRSSDQLREEADTPPPTEEAHDAQAAVERANREAEEALRLREAHERRAWEAERLAEEASRRAQEARDARLEQERRAQKAAEARDAVASPLEAQGSNHELRAQKEADGVEQAETVETEAEEEMAEAREATFARKLSVALSREAASAVESAAGEDEMEAPAAKPSLVADELRDRLAEEARIALEEQAFHAEEELQRRAREASRAAEEERRAAEDRHEREEEERRIEDARQQQERLGEEARIAGEEQALQAEEELQRRAREESRAAEEEERRAAEARRQREEEEQRHEEARQQEERLAEEARKAREEQALQAEEELQRRAREASREAEEEERRAAEARRQREEEEQRHEEARQQEERLAEEARIAREEQALQAEEELQRRAREACRPAEAEERRAAEDRLPREEEQHRMEARQAPDSEETPKAEEMSEATLGEAALPVEGANRLQDAQRAREELEMAVAQATRVIDDVVRRFEQARQAHDEEERKAQISRTMTAEAPEDAAAAARLAQEQQEDRAREAAAAADRTQMELQELRLKKEELEEMVRAAEARIEQEARMLEAARGAREREERLAEEARKAREEQALQAEEELQRRAREASRVAEEEERRAAEARRAREEEERRNEEARQQEERLAEEARKAREEQALQADEELQRRAREASRAAKEEDTFRAILEECPMEDAPAEAPAEEIKMGLKSGLLDESTDLEALKEKQRDAALRCAPRGGSEGRSPPATASPEAEAGQPRLPSGHVDLFAALDKDGDGELSVQEIKAGLRSGLLDKNTDLQALKALQHRRAGGEAVEGEDPAGEGETASDASRAAGGVDHGASPSAGRGAAIGGEDSEVALAHEAAVAARLLGQEQRQLEEAQLRLAAKRTVTFEAQRCAKAIQEDDTTPEARRAREALAQALQDEAEEKMHARKSHDRVRRAQVRFARAVSGLLGEELMEAREECDVEADGAVGDGGHWENDQWIRAPAADSRLGLRPATSNAEAEVSLSPPALAGGGGASSSMAPDGKSPRSKVSVPLDVREFFASLDMNGDGKLSIKELKAALKEHIRLAQGGGSKVELALTMQALRDAATCGGIAVDSAVRSSVAYGTGKLEGKLQLPPGTLPLADNPLAGGLRPGGASGAAAVPRPQRSRSPSPSPGGLHAADGGGIPDLLA